jgi:hypothetical protein
MNSARNKAPPLRELQLEIEELKVEPPDPVRSGRPGRESRTILWGRWAPSPPRG